MVKIVTLNSSNSMDNLPKKRKNKLNSGQALLLVLLGMGAALVLVLSVVSRSVTDISLTSQDLDSSRAFSAAEAGIENMLINPSLSSNNYENGLSYSGVVSDIGNSINYNLLEPLASGESATVWFVSHDENGEFTCADNDCYHKGAIVVYWGNAGVTSTDSDAPALEATVFYDTTGTAVTSHTYGGVKVARVAVDPKLGRDNGFSNDYSQVPITINGITYPFSKSISFSDLDIDSTCYNKEGCLLFMRIKPIYNNTPQNVAVTTVDNKELPSQGKLVESTGFAGTAQRKVEVVQTYKEPLSVFDMTVFAGGGISK